MVRVEELTEQLAVSSATIRRDAGELEKLGELRRVYGGAVRTGGRWTNRCSRQDLRGRTEKRRIAEAAARSSSPMTRFIWTAEVRFWSWRAC